MADETVIETRALSKTYSDFWGRPKVRALKALDLEVKRGEVFGLLGPNGSGKTTTIKLLLGLLFPTSGDAFVFGEPAAKVEKNERIGYLPEESYLYRFLNAEETLDFYGRLFDFELRGRVSGMAFIDMGDQFIALSEGRTQPPDRHRHFGLVVDDKEAVRTRLQELGVPVTGRGLDFHDPWGNLIQVVDYREIQFTKTDEVLRAMGLDGLEKTERAREELRAKGVEV